MSVYTLIAKLAIRVSSFMIQGLLMNSQMTDGKNFEGPFRLLLSAYNPLFLIPIQKNPNKTQRLQQVKKLQNPNLEIPHKKDLSSHSKKALIDLYEETLTLRVGKEELVYYADKSKKNKDKHFVHAISVIDFSKDDLFSGSTTTHYDDPSLSSSPVKTTMEVSSNFEEGYFDSEGDVTFLDNLLSNDASHNLASEVISDHEPEQNESQLLDRVFKSPSSFPIPVVDSDSFFEETDTSLSYSDNSLPEFETFSHYTEETRSGSTTTHANYSLPEYDSFLFKIEPDQGRLTSVVISDNSNVLLLEIPEFESFHFDPSFPRPLPEPPDVEISLVIETDVPEINDFVELNGDECFDQGGGEINFEADDSFTFVTWTFLPFLTYLEVSPLLSSTKNEDTIFDPGIFT
ncbi:hypothetical protein Tco_1134225 [Tanacetum coccineum]